MPLAGDRACNRRRRRPRGAPAPRATGSLRPTRAYRPLPCDAPLPSMQSLRISTSTYDERIKASVHMLCHLLGATLTGQAGPKQKVATSSPPARARSTTAAELGDPRRGVEWLHACVAAGERVDEAGIAPPPPEPEDETEAPAAAPGCGARRGRKPRRCAPLLGAGERDAAARRGLAASARVRRRAADGAPRSGSATARASPRRCSRCLKRHAAVSAAAVPRGAAGRRAAATRAPRASSASFARAKTPKTRPKTPQDGAKHAPDARTGARCRAQSKRGGRRVTRRAGERPGATASPRVGGGRWTPRRLAARGAPAAPASARARPRWLAVRREHDRRRRGGHAGRTLRGRAGKPCAGRRRRVRSGPTATLFGPRALASPPRVAAVAR